MKHTHHREERPEESRARMYLTAKDDFGAGGWKPAPQYHEAQKQEIESVIIEHLGGTDSPLCNLVEYITASVKPKPHLARVADVLRDLQKRGVIEVFDFVPHRFSLRDLDVYVRIRRPEALKKKLRTAC